ncbi:MAG: BREX system P-loop protein BrxC [Chloroflexota bacterium]|nr:BREX system P-loop protein BrxC [Chloroflexota bacterium]
MGEAVRSAMPGFASSPDAALAAFREQFPGKPDVSDAELTATVRELLASLSIAGTGTSGRRALPATLLVLDEVQQYVGDQSGRALDVQLVVERLQSEFDAQILLVCTGQSALVDTPQLQKLQGRFRVPVQLRTADVEEVVRRVVLLKRPDRTGDVASALEAVSGEIDRHLGGSRIGTRADDRADLVADYPLLPARRRFWEEILRAVDKTGQGGQLRSQLQVTQEAARLVADRPLGWVIPGDAAFDRLATGMVQTGVLLPGVEGMIAREREGKHPDAALRGRVLATVFLIGQLPTTGAAPAGVRADAAHVADLLVEDLPAGSARFRAEVGRVLDDLANDGLLMLVDGQYLLQTEEGQAWDQDFRGRVTAILNDAARVPTDRAQALKEAVAARLKGVTATQGATKTRRDTALHFGAEPPPPGDAIPVWVRDEWSVTERTVRDDATREGTESATIHVFLPRRGPEDLRLALARAAAAQATLDARPNPSTPEGQEARRGMQSRREEEQRKLDAAVAHVLDGARVYQGGNTEVVAPTLAEAVREALAASTARLYHGFTSAADDPRWANVVTRARSGADENPLKALGYDGDVTNHPVCSQVFSHFATGARSGLQIRRHFLAAPHGWPQDTIDGALLALVVDGKVRASHNGKARSPKDLIPGQIGQTEFAREATVLTTPQRLAVRGLLSRMLGGLATGVGDEAAAQKFLGDLVSLAEKAGGETPLPARPKTDDVAALRLQQGNGLLHGMFERKDDLERWHREWTELAGRVASRLARWERLRALLVHAEPLAELHADVHAQAEGIRLHRTLLAAPDPVPPLVARLTDALRAALNGAREREDQAQRAQDALLQETPEGKALSPEDWRVIYARQGVGPVAALDLSNDEKLLAELQRAPLRTRDDRIAALPAKFEAARLAAATLIAERTPPPPPPPSDPKGEDPMPLPPPRVRTPIRVKPPSDTLRTPDEVETYVARLRSLLLERVRDGDTVMI